MRASLKSSPSELQTKSKKVETFFFFLIFSSSSRCDVVWTLFSLTFLSLAAFVTSLGECGEEEAQTCTSLKLRPLLPCPQVYPWRKNFKVKG